MPRRKKRLDPAVFDLPVERIRSGFYTDAYFERARAVLQHADRSPDVLMQVSCKRGGWISGVDETVALLKLCSDDWSALTVHALFEGDRCEPWDTVLTIEGPYRTFAHLETLFLGVLGRRTMICTNARMCVEAARSKPVLLFGARDDLWSTQPGDGYAAYVGGVTQASTPAQGSFFEGAPVGTIPHALIAAFGGDTVAATVAFAEACPEVNVVALVDYENDSVRTSLDVARKLDGRLWGVRLDTAEYMVDRSVVPQMGAFKPTGVNGQLVWNVRNALDAEGFGDVKIVVSGGFNPQRIRAFEEDGVPVDVYAVGAAMVEGRADFTADIVQLDGAPQSKLGRELRPNARLERVK